MDQNTSSRPAHGEDPLAYGDYHASPNQAPQQGEEYGAEEAGQDGERGLIGDAYRKLRGKPPKPSGESSSGLGSFIFDKLHDAVHDIGTELNQRIASRGDKHSHTHAGTQCDDGMHSNTHNRYGSFATQRTGNDIKWFVDGCGYMWAVSRALEQATHSIWILDCEPI